MEPTTIQKALEEAALELAKEQNLNIEIQATNMAQWQMVPKEGYKRLGMAALRATLSEDIEKTTKSLQESAKEGISTFAKDESVSELVVGFEVQNKESVVSHVQDICTVIIHIAAIRK